MRFIYITFFLITSMIAYSQTEHVLETSNAVKELKYKTYVLDISKYNIEKVQLLKNELVGWDTKILMATINESNKTLVFSHTEQFNNIEFVEVLGKYGMSKKQVISYQ